MTPTPCRKNHEISLQLSNDSDTMQSGWNGCIISIRPTYSCASEFTYLFSYLHRITTVLCDWPVT